MPKTLWIVSMVRRVQTRSLRYKSPVRHKFCNYFGGGKYRLLRNGTLEIPYEAFVKYYDEFKDAADKGLIEVREDYLKGKLFSFEKTDKNVKDAIREVAVQLVESLPIPDDVVPTPVEEPKNDETSVELVIPDKLNKVELVKFASETLNVPAEELELLTKKEILAKLESLKG